MSEHTEKTEHEPDPAAEWYAERRAANLQQVESQLNELASYYSGLENTWKTLDEQEQRGHDELDTKLFIQTERERYRFSKKPANTEWL